MTAIVGSRSALGDWHMQYPDLHQRLYYSTCRIRRVEERVAEIYPTDKIRSPVHLSIGQEAVSVGACDMLQSEDVVFGTYRGHAMYLARGGDLKQMIAELYGKTTGCAKGKGGSMHLVDLASGVMGTSAVVGTTIPNAVGYAYALKCQRKKALVMSFFGDGAVEEGVFHESLNFAALKSLPVIFVCENNRYAIHAAQSARQSADNLVERIAAYGIPAVRVEDNDVLETHRCVGEVAQEIRDGRSGPAFFECMTYRWKEHVGPGDDFALGYRTKDEAEPWMKNDQLVRLAAMVSQESRQQIDQRIEKEIDEAFAYAEDSSFPDEVELYSDIFKGVV